MGGRTSGENGVQFAVMKCCISYLLTSCIRVSIKPKICARITYHGDELFWSRNIEECERIYAAKELSALQVRKPIVVAFLIGIIFYMIKSIVEARALRRRERIDPNMVETYRAIQMLTRQLRRAANGR